jgi:hypothetical protein
MRRRHDLLGVLLERHEDARLVEAGGAVHQGKDEDLESFIISG